MVDNFEIVKNNILKYSHEGEFYMALILKRRKDTKGIMPDGVNEDNRLIKHYFIYNPAYLEQKRQAIINLCEQNDARAYILPQRRDCRLVLWALHDKVSDTLRRGSMNTHFDHLIRSCVAGMHDVTQKTYKRWVIDIDADNPQIIEILKEFWAKHYPGEKQPITFVLGVFVDYIVYKLREALVYPYTCTGLKDRPEAALEFMPPTCGVNASTSYTDFDVYQLRTPHGYHVVTPPFNREPKAIEKYFGFAISSSWIKPDALTLIYAPDKIG